MENKLVLSQVLNETFNIYFNNIVKVTLPMLVSSALFYFVLNKIPVIYTTYGPTFMQSYASIGFILNTLAQLYLTSAIVIFVSGYYKGENNNYLSSFIISPKRFIGYVILSILIGLGTFLGILFFVVPGVFAILGWIAAEAVYFNEDDETFFSSIGRSYNLTFKNKGQIFGILFVVGIMGAIFTGILYLLLNKALPLFSTFTNGSFTEFTQNPLYTTITSSIYIPFSSILGIVIYFNLRKLKENFDVDLLSDNFMENDNE